MINLGFVLRFFVNPAPGPYFDDVEASTNCRRQL